MRTLVVALALAVVAGLAGTTPADADVLRAVHAVTIASASDASPGVLDAHARRQHGEIVRQALLDVLRRAGAEVRPRGERPLQIDVSVVRWRVASSAGRTDVSAELRVVVCDGGGRMRAIVTGRATVSEHGRRPQLAALRAQALAAAVGGMKQSLAAQLAPTTG